MKSLLIPKKFIKYFILLAVFSLNSYSNSIAASKAKSGQIPDLIKFCSELKGFNLLGKFDISWTNLGFTEKEIKLVHELGFNFIRLPLDYRTFTADGDWNTIVTDEIAEIDSAVAWAIKYNVHVSVNLHRAPGYCINSTTLPVNQQLNLWTDSVAQLAFINQWVYFAKHYQNISAEILSFDLVNEPSNVTENVYVPLMKRAIDSIHKYNPDRVVFVDGLNVGRDLVLSLKDEPNVGQSIHCYDPFSLTHYKAEWVSGSADLPVPKWPVLPVSNYLWGSWKADYKSALVIEGNFPKGTVVTVNVNQVSIESTLSIKAGTQTVLSKKFVCSANAGSDFTKVLKTEWGYQNISNKDFSATTTADATKISFENSSGDWMKINSFSFKVGDKLFNFSPGDDSWGKKQDTFKLSDNGVLKTVDGNDIRLFDFYRKTIETAKANNIAFMVQEFGVYNKTPHDVTIAFLTDLAKLFRDNKIGWALWNFSGSFGILNSDRSDCTYESYQGYLLDRQMLEALTIEPVLSVPLLKTSKLLNMFPNPVRDVLTLKPTGINGFTEIVVSDLTGRIVKKQSVILEQNKLVSMDISKLASNVYVLTLLNNGVSYSGKLIVQN